MNKNKDKKHNFSQPDWMLPDGDINGDGDGVYELSLHEFTTLQSVIRNQTYLFIHLFHIEIFVTITYVAYVHSLRGLLMQWSVTISKMAFYGNWLNVNTQDDYVSFLKQTPHWKMHSDSRFNIQGQHRAQCQRGYEFLSWAWISIRLL